MSGGGVVGNTISNSLQVHHVHQPHLSSSNPPAHLPPHHSLLHPHHAGTAAVSHAAAQAHAVGLSHSGLPPIGQQQQQSVSVAPTAQQQSSHQHQQQSAQAQTQQLHTPTSVGCATSNGSATSGSGSSAVGSNSVSSLVIGSGPGSGGNNVHPISSVATSVSTASSIPHIVPPSLGLSPQSSADSQQFNIFPAIFSRQLNFTAGTCGQSKLSMDELRPNLVGGLLGLQQGLLDDHAANMQHAGVSQDTKFMSFQDNRLMGITSSHENRLLGLTSSMQDTRSPLTSIDKGSLNHQRKCSSTPEDFSSLYSGLPTPGMDTSSHHHTPAHTPPTRLSDHSISGNCFIAWILLSEECMND